MSKLKLSILGISILTLGFIILSCNKKEDTTTKDDSKTVDVLSSNFLVAGLAEPISVVSKTLSDGSTADCYKIVVKGIPTDHTMGPWCPSNISDDATAGGIWLSNGNVYDVDGDFIKNMATFYNDNTWMMYKGGKTKPNKVTIQKKCEKHTHSKGFSVFAGSEPKKRNRH